jgi:excisionase family DNA binding protein
MALVKHDGTWRIAALTRCAFARDLWQVGISLHPGVGRRSLRRWRTRQDSNKWPSAPESGWVPQQGSPQLAKPAHSLTLGGGPADGVQHGLAPFDTKRADGNRIDFTVRELAEQLCVPTATVYRWVKDGKFEHLRLGGNVIRIPLPVLRRFLANTRPG